jgi:hypothetical protein
MEIFKAWSPDRCDEDEAQGVNAHDARDAAEKLVERNHANWDYCIEAEVSVRDPRGVKTEWIIEVRQVAEFYATPKRMKSNG